MGRSKATNYLTKEQMSQLTTKRLLAYRNSLLELPDWRAGPDAAWWQAEYERALEESKELLNAREHVERKPTK